MEEVKRRSGRPKKPDHEKVQYQRIAVYSQDYLRLSNELTKRNSARDKTDYIKLTDAFSEMVDNYVS